MLKHSGQLPDFFELVRYRTAVSHRRTGETVTEATVKIRVGDEEYLAVGEGVGPVDAIDEALRSAVRPFYPEIKEIVLQDYKVRIVNASAGTDARVCVMIESADRESGETWGTVGASANLIEASWRALQDSLVYGLFKRRENAE